MATSNRWSMHLTIIHRQVTMMTSCTVRSIPSFVENFVHLCEMLQDVTVDEDEVLVASTWSKVPLHKCPHQACFVFCSGIAREHFNMERRGHAHHRRRGERNAVTLPPGIGFQIPRPILWDGKRTCHGFPCFTHRCEHFHVQARGRRHVDNFNQINQNLASVRERCPSDREASWHRLHPGSSEYPISLHRFYHGGWVKRPTP